MGAKHLIPLLLLATPAQAVNCYPVPEMIERLHAKGQVPWEGGVRESGHVVVVFVNRATRDWTIAERRNAYLCITSEGQGWERRTPRLAETPL